MKNYWIQLLFISILSIEIVHLLNCESKFANRQNDAQFKTIYRKCLRNHTGNNIESKPSDKVEFDVNSYDYSSDEYEGEYKSKDFRGYNNMAGGNGKDIIRVRRQHDVHRGGRNNNPKDNNNRNKNDNNNSGNNGNETNFNNACLVQCLFQEIGLVNHNLLPDKNKVTSFMLTNVNDLEFRDFVIDSVNECFHYIEYNHVQDKCEFSKNLGDCLTERTKVNCDHWDRKNILF